MAGLPTVAGAAPAAAELLTPELRRTASQPPSPSKSLPDGMAAARGSGAACATPSAVAAALAPFLPLSQAKIAHKVGGAVLDPEGRGRHQPTIHWEGPTLDRATCPVMHLRTQSNTTQPKPPLLCVACNRCGCCPLADRQAHVRLVHGAGCLTPWHVPWLIQHLQRHARQPQAVGQHRLLLHSPPRRSRQPHRHPAPDQGTWRMTLGTAEQKSWLQLASRLQARQGSRPRRCRGSGLCLLCNSVGCWAGPPSCCPSSVWEAAAAQQQHPAAAPAAWQPQSRSLWLQDCRAVRGRLRRRCSAAGLQQQRMTSRSRYGHQQRLPPWAALRLCRMPGLLPSRLRLRERAPGAAWSRLRAPTRLRPLEAAAAETCRCVARAVGLTASHNFASRN